MPAVKLTVVQIIRGAAVPGSLRLRLEWGAIGQQNWEKNQSESTVNNIKVHSVLVCFKIAYAVKYIRFDRVPRRMCYAAFICLSLCYQLHINY